MRSINKHKIAARMTLSQHTAEYIARGNKIKEYDPSESAELPSSLKEVAAMDRQRKLAIDKAMLKEFHSNGQYLNIRYLPKCKTKDERFRLSHEAKVLGYFPTLTEAMSFVMKA